MTDAMAREAVILMAEDNPAEQRLAQRSLGDGLVKCDLRIVSDGEEALDYLHRRGVFADPRESPTPDLVLLDLNMPKVDGRQVLQQMKQDSDLKKTPVVILTTSQAEVDVARSYELGCNSYLTKPIDVADFIKTLQSLGEYWFKLVVLPPKERKSDGKDRSSGRR